ncbi:MAG: hypothetical protein M3R25_14980 [Bacteroidota bacterium]|nr:hypothetical protein [Bacteroidota bacterium]
MKQILLISSLFLMVVSLHAQKDTSTFVVMVNGKEYKTQPRRLNIGHYGYITGNAIGPDKCLRIWLADFYGKEIKEPGTYLIVDAYYPDTKQNINEAIATGKYKGLAAIKYVEETKSPRMEYHVGMSENNGETVQVTIGSDGYTEFTFNSTLVGSYWKEKAMTTAFGGVGRIVDKMENKAVTGATGFEQDIDPEGNGYKKQKETDTIVLTDGKVRFKMK